MRLEAVRRLWQRLVEHGPAALEEPESFTDSERDAGRMILPLLHDLQEARRAIDDATRTTRALEAALDHLPVAAIVLDDESRFLTANSAAKALFGGPAIPQIVLKAAEQAGKAETPIVVRIPGGRPVRTVPGELRGPATSRVFFLVPADGTFEIETDHLQERFGLTPTQARIVGLVAQGLTNKEIAARLEVSPETVHKHLAAAFQRTGVSARAGLVTLAFGSRFGIEIPPA